MRIVRIAAVMGALVAVGLGLVQMRNETRQCRYTLSRMQERQQALRRQTQDLQLEIARLRSPARLAQENERLGLKLSPLVTVRAGSTSGE